MTDNEKSRELSCQTYLTKEDEELGPPEDVKIQINSYWAAMKMAEYKNDKFFAILACIKFSLEKSGSLNGVDEFINSIQKQWEE